MIRLNVCLQLAAVAAASLLCASGAQAADLLANKAGMTMYVFDKDSPGKSACNGACATAWPPVADSEISGPDFAGITRDDGSRQLAFKGKPLYLFAGDGKPGDRLGNGMNGAWHAASPTAAAKPQSGSKPVADPYGYSNSSSSY
jgi:predicted lipoprotein with Yx(FWY)xxD motif